MKEELQAHEEYCTWEVVRLPPNKKAIGNKWIFTKKMDENGNLICLTVLQGFHQKYGIDYHEVFAPVVKQTFQTLLSIATRRGMLVKHIGVYARVVPQVPELYDSFNSS